MLNQKTIKGINIETLVLVAVWETPFIFQGCFKITELEANNTTLFFFRCRSHHAQQFDILNHDFLPEEYEFTHLYNEEGIIQLGSSDSADNLELVTNLDSAQEGALYLLKYALHITLGKMLSNRTTYFTSIDDIAMQALMDKARPILLNTGLTLPEEEHIGFAVAMDFYPEETTGLAAARTLLKDTKTHKH